MKKVKIIGGGTISHVRNHLALAMPAFGTTARQLYQIAKGRFKDMDIELVLTRMADHTSRIETNADVEALVAEWKKDLDVKVIFFNVGLCDFEGIILEKDFDDNFKYNKTESGKYAPRLNSSYGEQDMLLIPAHKIVKGIRNGRKDITLVAFKTTCNASDQEQYKAGLNLMKKASCNLVVANDVGTRKNVIITPEEARYHETMSRYEVLKQVVDMAWYRSQLTFTRSTVVDGNPVPWDSPEVYPALKTIVDYCIEQNAYKPFNGATVGHFACKINDTTFLTSIRKSNFNDLAKNGLVKVETTGNDTVIAYGAKPSVGGQSQRIIFTEHGDYDCIVHFHCPKKEGSPVPVVSQREYECGSHQCGQNTSNGLQRFGNLSAVMLDNHGPNIVFHHSINPQEVIDFINENFDLKDKTGGIF